MEKALRRQQYARGRRKGSKHVKTGQSLSRRAAQQPPARWPAAEEQLSAGAPGLAVEFRFELRQPMSMRPVGHDLGAARALRRAAPARRGGFARWHGHFDNGTTAGTWRLLDALTCFHLDQAHDSGQERVDLWFGGEHLPHWNDFERMRLEAEEAHAPEQRAGGRTRSRRERRRARREARRRREESPSGSGSADESGGEDELRGWRRAAAASHLRCRTAGARREDMFARYGGDYRRGCDRGVSGKRLVRVDAEELPPRPPPPQSPPPPRPQPQSPPPPPPTRHTPHDPRCFLPARLWALVFELAGALGVGLATARDVGDAVRARVRSLRVPASRDWPRVVGLRRWPGVRALSLVNAQQGGLVALCRDADAAACARLRRLRLDYNGIEDVGLSTLALALEAGRFPALRALLLRGNEVRRGADSLADALLAGHAPRLRVLDLSGVMRAPYAAAFAERLLRGVALRGALPGLRVLALGSDGETDRSRALQELLRAVAGRVEVSLGPLARLEAARLTEQQRRSREVSETAARSYSAHRQALRRARKKSGRQPQIWH